MDTAYFYRRKIRGRLWRPLDVRWHASTRGPWRGLPFAGASRDGAGFRSAGHSRGEAENGISAQITPAEDPGPAIEALVGVLDVHGLEYEVGSRAPRVGRLRRCLRVARGSAAATFGQAVMSATVSNACPLPPGRGGAR